MKLLWERTERSPARDKKVKATALVESMVVNEAMTVDIFLVLCSGLDVSSIWKWIAQLLLQTLSKPNMTFEDFKYFQKSPGEFKIPVAGQYLYRIDYH